jgi:TatD DNase family protein
MIFIDSHAHINSLEFKSTWPEIVQAADHAGVTSIINNAADLASTEWGIEQSHKSPHLFATAGIHPEYFLESTQPISPSDYNNLRRLIKNNPKVVAIGEIGLDYTLDLNRAPIARQHELFRQQLKIALEFNLPITLHVRDQPNQTACFTDMITILQEYTTSQVNSNNSSKLRGVFHCWTGTPSQAQQALELGFYLSFSGILTYKSAGHITEAAKLAPLDKILIETDAPYLTPEPARTTLRPSVNQPKYVIMTAEKLASIKGETLQAIAEATTQNTRHLFNLPG